MEQEGTLKLPASRIKSKQQHMYNARPCESLNSTAAELSSSRTSIQSGILRIINIEKRKEEVVTPWFFLSLNVTVLRSYFIVIPL